MLEKQFRATFTGDVMNFSDTMLVFTEEPPTHYVFLYGNASQYRATLHQKLDNPSGAFAFWEACAAESPGHVFALSSAQLAQLDALFTGEAPAFD